MQQIPLPDSNVNDPDPVLAQTVAADSRWSLDDAGHVYDHRGTYVAGDLAALGVVMRDLGWFVARGAMASGVHWKAVPRDHDTRSTAVRARTRFTN